MNADNPANPVRHGALGACSVLTGLGWTILAGSVLIALWGAYETIVKHEQYPQAGMTLMLSGKVASIILMGLLALMLAQLIKYAFGTLDEAPILVRHGDKILFLYAAVAALSAIGHLRFLVLFTGHLDSGFLLTAFISLSQILILAGAGVVLRKVVPAIHELRSIV